LSEDGTVIDAGPLAIENTGFKIVTGSNAEAESTEEEGCVLILHNWPRGRNTPCISPFPLKLETFLRVFGIKYEVSPFCPSLLS